MPVFNPWVIGTLSRPRFCHHGLTHAPIWLILVIGLFPFDWSGGSTLSALASDSTIVHHHLTIQLVPDTHELLAQDTITVKADDRPRFKSPLRLSLNRNLTVEHIEIGTKPTTFDIVDPPIVGQDAQPPIQTIEISGMDQLSPGTPLTLLVRYKGKLKDPPRPAKGLRFVRPDRTLGHIGSEGIYLTSETAWYPGVTDTLSTYTVQVTLPHGWRAVTQGRQVSEGSERHMATATWEVATASEALTLVANRFVKHQRDWKGIEMATYLFPEDAHLSDQYLDATAEYLEVYTKLLGPYPFKKFAVVENFFPSGLGLPSYTLLGSRVIKRGYTQPYSLGHEIVHSWFGNSVLNDFTKGNWVEGLTTYLANYYYEELQGSTEIPLKTRQRMFYEYNLYATSTEDYPLIQFHHKETRIDNAIGYQKAAMVFHMLRREIGDNSFFSGIRALVKERSGGYADWDTLEQVFEGAAGRELGWFFTQWVEQAGAPFLRIVTTDIQEDSNSSGGVLIDITAEQTAPPYQLKLPITVELANGQTHETSIIMKAGKSTAIIPVPTKPTRLVVDPRFEMLRRLHRAHIPPMLNVWVTDQKATVLLPNESLGENTSVYQPILHRLQSRQLKVEIQGPDEDLRRIPHSILILDDPHKNLLTSTAIKSCHNDIALKPTGLTIETQTFEGPEIAWLISCPHPTQAGHTITVFSGFSDSAVSHVARLLFFYGWDSYLVFSAGKVVTRGMIETVNKDLEVSL